MDRIFNPICKNISFLTILLIFKFCLLKQSKCVKLNSATFQSDSEKSVNMSLEKVNKYYAKLYSRLHSQDFGFATFGKPCEPIELYEFENFMDIAEEIIKDQEEDGKYRRSVEEHLRPKLRAFYYRSRDLCDFQKLLTCDPLTKKCACAHSTLGIGRNERCQVNIGKRCNFKQEEINENFNVLVLPKLKTNLTCMGEAECVSSFGASTKICKCRSGFWGANCKASLFIHPSQDKGRSFGVAASKDRSFWELDKNNEYFLYPEEIKEELVKMMNFRDIYNPEDREKEADELYAKMESDINKEEMVTLDIFIRRAATLEYDDPCDPSKQITLDNPPVSQKESTWIDPNPEEVQNWQLSILKDGKPICNYLTYLQCDSDTSSCKCKRGLKLDSGKCRAVLGQSCGSDYDGTFEFDPLRDRTRFSTPYSPQCITRAVCEAKPLFFVKQCWCESPGKCDASISNAISTPAELLDQVNSRFILPFGEMCDPESHALMINPPEDRRFDLNTRIESIVSLLGADPKVNFCNLAWYHNCSESAKKCECWENMVQEGGQCRVKNLESCGSNYIYGTSFYPNGPTLWKVEQLLDKEFAPQCISSAKCGGTELPGKCHCKNGKAGELCNDPKSVFASVMSPYKVSGYYKDVDINKVLYTLNFYTFQIEALMTLKYNDKCDPVSGVMLQRIVNFYQTVGNSDEEIASNLTLNRYEKVAKWTQYLLRTGTKELCNAFIGLFCHEKTMTCNCGNRHIYEDKWCKLNKAQDCDPKPPVSWIPSCRNNTECLPTDSSHFSCQCKKDINDTECSDLDVLPPEGNKNGTDCPSGKLCDIVVQPPTTEPGEGKEKNTTTEPSPEDYFDRIVEMLEVIIKQRNLTLGNKCEKTSEEILTRHFPHLPRFDRRDYNQFKQPLAAYSKLKLLYNAETKFCDRKMHYSCFNGSCACSERSGMKMEGGVCKLKEFSYCGQIGTYYDKSVPLPGCGTGMKCIKLDYGVRRCIHTARSTEHM